MPGCCEWRRSANCADGAVYIGAGGKMGGKVKAAAIALAALAALALLAGCSWFGSDEPAPASGSTASSEEILKKDCADPKWKEQNLGLWYSVCRPSLNW
jgi:hypothetical protein